MRKMWRGYTIIVLCFMLWSVLLVVSTIATVSVLKLQKREIVVVEVVKWKTKVVTKVKWKTKVKEVVKWKTKVKEVVKWKTKVVGMPNHLKLAEARGLEHTIHKAHQGITYGYGIDLRASPDLGLPALAYAGVSPTRLMFLKLGKGVLTKIEIEEASNYVYILKRQKADRLMVKYTRRHLHHFNPTVQAIMVNLVYKGDIRTSASVKKSRTHYYIWKYIKDDNLINLTNFIRFDRAKDTKRIKRRLMRSGLIKV